MRSTARIAAVWVLLGVGLGLVLLHVPKPGVGKDPIPVREGLPPLDPGSAEAQYARGVIALGEGRPKEALAALDKAIAMDPANAAARVQKAFALSQMPKPDPSELRDLLAEASRLGFDRAGVLAREERIIAQGLPPGVQGGAGRLHLERAVLLGFGEPANPAEALRALQEARACGTGFPEELEAALAQVQALPDR